MQKEVRGRACRARVSGRAPDYGRGPSEEQQVPWPSWEVEEEPGANWRASEEVQEEKGKVGQVLKAHSSTGQSPRAKAGTV